MYGHIVCRRTAAACHDVGYAIVQSVVVIYSVHVQTRRWHTGITLYCPSENRISPEHVVCRLFASEAGTAVQGLEHRVYDDQSSYVVDPADLICGFQERTRNDQIRVGHRRWVARGCAQQDCPTGGARRIVQNTDCAVNDRNAFPIRIYSVAGTCPIVRPGGQLHVDVIQREIVQVLGSE